PVAASPQAQALAALIRATLAQTRPWPHRDSLVGIVPPPHPLPIELLTDARLAPADKLAWWAIAQFSQTDHAITPFPELAALARLVNVNSPKTAARALIMLRLTGWLTRAHYRIDNAPARHLSLLHAAPLTWIDAVYLDPTLPAFVADMQRHSHAQVRKLAAAIAEQAAQFTGETITAAPVCTGIEPDLPAVDRQNLPLPVQTEAVRDEAHVKLSGSIDSTVPPAMDAGADHVDVPPRHGRQNLPPPQRPETASDGTKARFTDPTDSTAPPGSPTARQILPSDTSSAEIIADGTAGMLPGCIVEGHPMPRQTVSSEGDGAHVAIDVHQAPAAIDAGPAQADVPAKHRRQNLPPPLPPESTSDGTKAEFTDPADSAAPPGSLSARQILPSDTSSADINADGAAGMPPDRWDHENTTTRQPISDAEEGEWATDDTGFSPSDVDTVPADAGISKDQRGQNLPVRCSSSYIKQKTTTTP
ncbi:MAG: hypothetical protein KDI88_18895, partial [Gammaproteobacteria bacterium]|nr:hypothetical protein [Gammaproteobacteria bacterium]